MKILVTGATGFIGRRLLPGLGSAHELFALCRGAAACLPPDVSAVEADLRKPASWDRLKEIRPDVCVHLAWEGLPDYGPQASSLNVGQTSRFWQYIVQECGCRKIVGAGTCGEYGRTFGLCREKDRAKPDSPYALAKQALLDFGSRLAREHQAAFIWGRIFYAYGPGQRSGSLIPAIAAALKNNEAPLVKTPHNAHDFIHVDDIAGALAMMAQKEIPEGIYNLGSGFSTPVWRICEEMERAFGRKPQFAPRLWDSKLPAAADFWADTVKTTRVLGWKARIGLSEGLQMLESCRGI